MSVALPILEACRGSLRSAAEEVAYLRSKLQSLQERIRETEHHLTVSEERAGALRAFLRANGITDLELDKLQDPKPLG